MIRPATQKDFEFMRSLRNTKEFMPYFNRNYHFSVEQFKELLKEYTNIWIIVYKLTDVGYVTLTQRSISIIIDKKYHGLGIGTATIKELTTKYPNLIAQVKKNNPSSIKIFKNAGFKIKSKDKNDIILEYSHDHIARVIPETTVTYKKGTIVCMKCGLKLQ